MGFTNYMREDTDHDKSIQGRRMSGWVVQNNDPTQNQRVQVRIHDLHDNIADGDLPYFAAGNLSSESGAANIGAHGPIPPVGTKVWVKFGDDSQYHGSALGGVATTQNQIPEFVGKGAYGDHYPNAWGGVDASGSFSANSSKTDDHERVHVSGTGTQIDGKGNVNHVVNGNAPRKDNPNASSKFSKGATVSIFGGLSLYVSGAAMISVGGNASVTANGDAMVSAKGKGSIVAGGDVDVSAGGAMALKATGAMTLVAPSITSSVPITTGASGTPTTPGTVAPQTAPTPRSRPNSQIVSNDETY